MGAPRAPRPSPPTARPPGRAAATALFLATAAAVVVVALADAPAAWRAADPVMDAAGHPAIDPTVGETWTTPWAPLLELLGSRLPLFWGSARIELLLWLLVVATAAAAAWACHQLFRGPGRAIAAVTAGTITAWSLLALDEPTGRRFPELAFSLLTTIAVGHQLRSLVHFGTVTAVARARSLVAAGVATTFAPVAGAPIYLLLLAVSLLRARRFDTRRSRGPWAPPRVLPLVLGVTIPAAVWILGLTTGQLGPPTVPDLSLRLPGAGWSASIPTALAYPALALVVVLVAPLRWRGGWTLIVMVLGAFVFHGDGELIAPDAARVVMLVTAASGWVWLAGSLLPRRPLPGRLLALTAAGIVAALRIAPDPAPRTWPVQSPAAHDRPARSLVAAYARGLVAPGDVLLVSQPWLHDAFVRQQSEGFRPDVLTIDLSQIDDQTLAVNAMGWAEDRRRVLSDSFTVGGRWNADWAVDAGTVFWLVGTAAREAELVDIGEFLPLADDRRDPELARRWAWLFVERARFRRVRAGADAALQALPVDDRLALTDEVRRSALRRAPARGETELGRADPRTPAGALVKAEAGDLLLASGAPGGAQLLAGAGDEGLPSAWGALARWQLRASSSHGAEAAIARLSSDEALREPALDVLEWLVLRDRIDEARELRDRLAPTGQHVEREIATRLSLLAAQAGRTPPTANSDPP